MSRHLVCPHCAAVNRLPEERLQQPGADGAVCGKCKGTLFTGAPVEVDAAGFDVHRRRSEVPVLVDFWAPWCGPCRTMGPNFAQAAGVLEPAVRLLKVNTEQEQQLAGALGIRSIPTLALYVGGQEVARQAGAMDAANIVRWVQANLPR